MFKQEMEFIKGVLPERYKCELRNYGVYCYDPTHEGICDDHMSNEPYNPETDNQLALIVKAMEQKFGSKLLEIYGIEPQTFSKFSVYLSNRE